MPDEHSSVLVEIREILKAVINGQDELVREIRELKEVQRKLHEEIRLNNYVLNNISTRSEILN